ncbi:MAG: alanine/glycine:cation symporter family protein [Sphingomonadaceae bacterium]
MATTGLVDTLSAGIDRLSALVFFQFELGGAPVQLIVLWLAAAMVFATVWLGLPQVRGFRLGWQALFGRFADPTAPGGISQFQALSTALASTVGLGNIAGVAVAVAMGGPGAILWMIVIGFFAMALKCAEVTLGLLYRDELPDGSVRGGPALTLTRGLAAIGLPRLGRWLAGFHAVFMILGCLSLFQVNQAHAQLEAVAGPIDPLLFGLAFAGLAALVLLGSIGWIGRVTGRLVPAMCLLYVGACLVVILANLAELPAALLDIAVSAFAPEAVAGGAIGVFIIGMRRAVYSSEAGIGTAVVAHVQARTRDPASEGMVALIEPFIDTVVICTLTGLTLVVTGMVASGLDGVQMTSAALGTVIGPAPQLLALVVFLFAYSTAVANGFYATQAFQHLVGHGRLRELAIKVFFCAQLSLGALLDFGKILDLVDSAFFLMAVPNVIAIYLLARPLRAEIDRYLFKHMKD